MGQWLSSREILTCMGVPRVLEEVFLPILTFPFLTNAGLSSVKTAMHTRFERQPAVHLVYYWLLTLAATQDTVAVDTSMSTIHVKVPMFTEQT